MDGLTVERIYGTPDLSGMSIQEIGWSPDGKTLSFIRGCEQRNELLGFDVASASIRQLFDFSRLPGAGSAGPPRQAEGQGHWRTNVRAVTELSYEWTPDGKRLLLTAAGGVPHLLDIEKDQLAPIVPWNTPLRDARISPDGRFVSFVAGWDLYMVELFTGKVFALTSGSTESLRSATPDTMGDVMAGVGHWWSPDASQIAYIQTDERSVPTFWYADLLSPRGWNIPERYPQPGDPIPVTVLKVVRRGAVTAIDTRPWVGWYMARVSWLPDSRHLALQMLSRDHTRLSVVIADSFTGAARTVLTETDPCWVNVVDDLRFFSDSRHFIWSSERDSYRQLYIYGIDGELCAQLTTGEEACVGVVGLDEANGAVYYQTWPAPYTEAHLNRATFRQEGAVFHACETTRITTEGSSHFAHLSPDCALFADSMSTAVRPPHLELYRVNGDHVATVEENPCAELKKYGLREFEFLSLPTARLGLPSDEMPQHAKLLEPANREPGKQYPVIVYIYGGPLPGGFGLARNVLDYWRPVPELWLQMMSQRGFGVFSLDNRGSNAAPRGHAWETPIHRQLGRVELSDQLEGVAYLKSLDWVDPERIGIVGGSFGGFMTLNAMLNAPGTFKAAVAYAPVTNWLQYDCVYTERYMDLPQANPQGYQQTMIPPAAGALAGDLLLVHGASDPNVHLQHSMHLVDQLVTADKRFQMMFYPSQVHMSFFGKGHSPARLWSRITTFFENHLTSA